MSNHHQLKVLPLLNHHHRRVVVEGAKAVAAAVEARVAAAVSAKGAAQVLEGAAATRVRHDSISFVRLSYHLSAIGFRISRERRLKGLVVQ